MVKKIPPIWDELSAIGEAASTGTWDSVPTDLSMRISDCKDMTEHEEKLVLLGSTLLANLISQQRFDEPHIEWLDFMNIATEYRLAVEHPTRDEDLCWSMVSAPESPTAEKDILPLAKLGRWVLQMREDSDCADLGGDEIQEKAGALGLLEEVEATEPCGDKCYCNTWALFPRTCVRLTDKAKVLDK